MLTEPKYCEMCQRQFFRAADVPQKFRARYCDVCERDFARAAQEQESNRLMVGRQYFDYTH